MKIERSKKSELQKVAFLGVSPNHHWYPTQQVPKRRFLKKQLCGWFQHFLSFYAQKTAILRPALLLFGVFQAPSKTRNEGGPMDSRVWSNAVKKLFDYRYMDSTKSKQKTSTSIFGGLGPLNEGTVLIWTLQPPTLVHLVMVCL